MEQKVTESLTANCLDIPRPFKSRKLQECLPLPPATAVSQTNKTNGVKANKLCHSLRGKRYNGANLTHKVVSSKHVGLGALSHGN